LPLLRIYEKSVKMRSSPVCVDASLALKWLLGSQQQSSYDLLLYNWTINNIELVCPPLFHAEITSVIRKQVYYKQIKPEVGDKAFHVYLALPIREVRGPDLNRRAWELAKKLNLPRTCDMQYLAAAELEDCELWTADERLYNSCHGKNERVRWIGGPA
jgi:predicted nucleic acid-binding protein